MRRRSRVLLEAKTAGRRRATSLATATLHTLARGPTVDRADPRSQDVRHHQTGSAPRLGSGTASERIRRRAVAAVYLARNRLARHPSVALPIERVLHHGEVVDVLTDIVIEGAPSSAN